MKSTQKQLLRQNIVNGTQTSGVPSKMFSTTTPEKQDAEQDYIIRMQSSFLLLVSRVRWYIDIVYNDKVYKSKINLDINNATHRKMYAITGGGARDELTRAEMEKTKDVRELLLAFEHPLVNIARPHEKYILVSRMGYRDIAKAYSIINEQVLQDPNIIKFWGETNVTFRDNTSVRILEEVREAEKELKDSLESYRNKYPDKCLEQEEKVAVSDVPQDVVKDSSWAREEYLKKEMQQPQRSKL